MGHGFQIPPCKMANCVRFLINTGAEHLETIGPFVNNDKKGC